MKKKILLNLGAGKVDLGRFEQLDFSHIIHVDRSYTKDESNILESDLCNDKSDDCVGIAKHYFIGLSLFDFLDNFPYKVDEIMAERIFEHLDYTSGEIGRMLEALNTITNDVAILNIIVPNAILVARMLLDYEEHNHAYSHTDSLNIKLIINSELVNIRSDPHLSIWSPQLAGEYINSEGTWKIDKLEEKIKFRGRDIYMSILCEKVR